MYKREYAICVHVSTQVHFIFLIAFETLYICILLQNWNNALKSPMHLSASCRLRKFVFVVIHLSDIFMHLKLWDSKPVTTYLSSNFNNGWIHN